MAAKKPVRRVGFVGLGRMGFAMASRLLEKGIEVVATNLDPSPVKKIAGEGAEPAESLEELVSKLPPPRVVWLMVPAGKPVDDTIFGSGSLSELLEKGDIIVDGGNSNFRDSLRRASELHPRRIHYVDCGTSGGLAVGKEGACLMVGGEREAIELLEDILGELAVESGWAHVGPAGAGHFVKMVHNGIEYGFLEALGEGFELLRASPFDLDLEKVAALWQRGSIIRCWLLSLTERRFGSDPDLESIGDEIGGGSTGRWTIEEAWTAGVSAPLIALAYDLRLRSRKEESFASKVVAALRNEFGGHPTSPPRKR